MVASVEHTSRGRLATVRLTQESVDHAVVTDLLFASSGIEQEVASAAERMEIVANVVLPVAGLATSSP